MPHPVQGNCRVCEKFISLYYNAVYNIEDPRQLVCPEHTWLAGEGAYSNLGDDGLIIDGPFKGWIYYSDG